MTFRYDIGLLRAIAICFVLLYHYQVPFFDGGYIGVDVFFVLSGFLMTKIILFDIEKDCFSYLSFIEKRIRRIVPPLLCVVAVILVLMPLLYFDVDLKQNAKYILMSLTFLSNIYYATLSGNYFSSEIQDNLFLHSWSLSVEWQFYLFYPVLLLSLKEWYLHHVQQFRIILVAFAGLSLICWLHFGDRNAWSFYMIPTRAWEFLLGGLAFLYSNDLKVIFKRILVPLTVVSLLMLLSSPLFLGIQLRYSAILVLIPTFGTAIILALGVQFIWFKNSQFQYLGKISYSLYLWHWPLYVLFRKYEFIMQSTYAILLPISLTFFFAVLTYYLVERKKKITHIKGLLIAGGAIAFFAVFLFAQPKLVIWDNSRLVDHRYINYFQQDEHKHLNPCNCYITRSPRYNVYDEEFCLSVDPKKENILLMGDSHAAQFSTEFRNAMKSNQNLLEMSLSLTFPFPNPKGYNKSVQLWRYFYNNFLPENKAYINKVFISVHWLMNTYTEMNYTPKEIERGLSEMITLFESYGLDYYFLGQTELYRIPYRQIALKKMFNSALNEEVYSISEARKVNDFLKRNISSQHYIDIYKHREIKHNSIEMAMPYMFDQHHLSAFGAKQVVAYLVNKGYL